MTESILDKRSDETVTAGYFSRVSTFARNNSKLTIGLGLVLIVVLFGYVGPVFVDLGNTEVGSAPLGLSPSSEHWLGTDAQGRDMLAWLMEATPATLRVASAGLVTACSGQLEPNALEACVFAAACKL